MSSEGYNLTEIMQRDGIVLEVPMDKYPFIYRVVDDNTAERYLVFDAPRFSALKLDQLRAIEKILLNHRFHHTFFVDSLYFGELETLVVDRKKKSKEKSAEKKSSTLAKLFLISIFGKAKKMGCSDIHFVRDETHCEVFFRIDGNKKSMLKVKGEKVDSAMSVFYNVEATSKGSSWNRTVPQDAMGTLTINPGEQVNLRYAHAPVKTKNERGYHAVFRILAAADESKNSVADLSSLGFNDAEISLIKKMVSRPFGLMVVAGTTGSGKSTTIKGFLEWLYSSFHNESISVLTVEDPVEYNIYGAVQSNVKRNERNGAGDENPFMKYIYSAMRRDPDVLLVGETRDPMTATALTDVVESGHLGVTSLHASSVLGVVSRLNSLGISTEKMRSSDFWAGIIAQKLIKCTCPHCSLSFQEGHELLSEGTKKAIADGVLQPSTMRISSAKGCPECGFKGLKGRQICAEFLFPYSDVVNSFQTNDAEKHWKKSPDGVTGKRMSERALDLINEGRFCPNEFERVFGVM